MSRLLLAGDIGGTKTNIGLYAETGGVPRLLRDATLRSADFACLADLFGTFFGPEARAVDAACFGVAGPVRNARVSAPNLPWTVDAREIAAHLGTPRVTLVNDLVATGHGISGLCPENFSVLQEGRADPEGNGAVIAAGTGLGQAFLFRCGGRFVPSPSEGGHGGFAPTSELEIELLRFLGAEFSHVSAERVVSGPGLRNIYRFLTITGKERETPRVRERMAREDGAAVISEEGLAGSDAACARALDLWVRAYGAEAGNLALKVLATGGVYVGGGIAPKILPKLQEGSFLAAFRGKEHLTHVLANVPILVILDPKTALRGAAALAAKGGASL